MATFKAIVEKHYKKKDGTYNVRIRVTHQRKKKYLSTTFFLTKEQLTKGLKIKDQKILDQLDAIVKRYRDACNTLGIRLNSMTIEQLVEYIKTYTGKPFTLDFIQYFRNVIEQLKKDGRNGSAGTYSVTLNSLIKFINRDFLDVSEITTNFLNEYVKWLRDSIQEKGKKGERAASLYTSNIQCVHNLAKKEFNEEDIGQINIPQSPFSRFKIPPSPTTRKKALPLDVIKKIVELPYSHREKSVTNLTKDVFIISFALMGTNAIDLYNASTLDGNILIYNRTKTKDRRQDRAEIRIKIEPEIMPIINKYLDPTKERVFIFYKAYKTIATFRDALFRGTKQIEDRLGIDGFTFYAARHNNFHFQLKASELQEYFS